MQVNKAKVFHPAGTQTELDSERLLLLPLGPEESVLSTAGTPSLAASVASGFFYSAASPSKKLP